MSAQDSTLSARDEREIVRRQQAALLDAEESERPVRVVLRHDVGVVLGERERLLQDDVPHRDLARRVVCTKKNVLRPGSDAVSVLRPFENEKPSTSAPMSVSGRLAGSGSSSSKEGTRNIRGVGLT